MDSTVEGRVESHSKLGLFVVLPPGITGLLLDGIMRATKTADQFKSLDKDAPVELEIQQIDVATPRITLTPKGIEAQPEPVKART